MEDIEILPPPTLRHLPLHTSNTSENEEVVGNLHASLLQAHGPYAPVFLSMAYSDVYNGNMYSSQLASFLQASHDASLASKIATTSNPIAIPAAKPREMDLNFPESPEPSQPVTCRITDVSEQPEPGSFLGSSISPRNSVPVLELAELGLNDSLLFDDIASSGHLLGSYAVDDNISTLMMRTSTPSTDAVPILPTRPRGKGRPRGSTSKRHSISEDTRRSPALISTNRSMPAERLASSYPGDQMIHDIPVRARKRSETIDEGLDGESRKEAKLEKNRQSARECRRRKKEYILALEEELDKLAAQNTALRSRMGEMELTNRDLIGEVQELRARLAGLDMSTA